MNITDLFVDRVRQVVVNRNVSPKDVMAKGRENEHYFNVGKSALLSIMAALAARQCYAGGHQPIEHILDFGCGHGRVARYLKAAFPDAVTKVTDLSQDGVRWCVDVLGCEETGPTLPANTFDLIWVGSVFTHLTAAAAAQLLGELKAALRENGVLLITTRGRFAALNRNPKGPSPEGAAAMMAAYDIAGYGFAEYAKTPGYGVCTVNPSWYFTHACDDTTIQIALQEKGWDSNQDVLAFMRHNLASPTKGPVAKVVRGAVA